MNIFSRQISVYDGVTDNVGRVITLHDFLFSKEYSNVIQMMRCIADKEERDKWKRRLPQAAISGVFAPTRAVVYIKQYSGLISIDVDSKENPDITNWEELKTQLAVLPQIAYCSLSVSGKGIFAIIPLRYPQNHLQQFRQLQIDFEKMGITIDKACSDITRMRCMSYDEHPLINMNAIPYEGVYVEPPRKVFYPLSDFNGNDDFLAVEKCCEIISRTGTDVTVSYEQWMKVGCSLATLGEDGRPFFHICSQQNQDYNELKTDKLFSDLLKRNYQSVSIGTFFWICRQYGIRIHS